MKKPHGALCTDRVGDRPARLVTESVFDEVVALFFRLRVVAERLHAQGEGAAGRRAVMRELRRLGPRTVPQMARARPVSRQSMQSTANQLAREGLLKFVDNPAHKRSKLYASRPPVKHLLHTMDAKEAQALTRLDVDVSEEDMRKSAEVLSSLRRALEDEGSWALAPDVREDGRRQEAR